MGSGENHPNIDVIGARCIPDSPIVPGVNLNSKTNDAPERGLPAAEILATMLSFPHAETPFG
jgi:hypothetical protein